MAFQISGVGQNQIGESGGFRLEGIADNDERDFVLAVGLLIHQHLAHFAGIHGGVPSHVGHEQQQGVDGIGITAPGVGNGVVHQAMRRQRMLPGEALVQTHRLTVGIHEQIIR